MKAGAIRVLDVAAEARAMYGDAAPYIVGRPLPEHDYRFEMVTPTGGTVSFFRGATAADVAAYCANEGWTP